MAAVRPAGPDPMMTTLRRSGMAGGLRSGWAARPPGCAGQGASGGDATALRPEDNTDEHEDDPEEEVGRPGGQEDREHADQPDQEQHDDRQRKDDRDDRVDHAL